MCVGALRGPPSSRTADRVIAQCDQVIVHKSDNRGTCTCTTTSGAVFCQDPRKVARQNNGVHQIMELSA